MRKVDALGYDPNESDDELELTPGTEQVGGEDGAEDVSGADEVQQEGDVAE
jgi:hypothetical protein